MVSSFKLLFCSYFNAHFLDAFAKLILQIRKREWPVDGVPLLAKMNMKLQASQAAAAVMTIVLKSEWKPSRSPTDRRSSKSPIHEIVALLLDTADACLASPWRRMRSCEFLFGTLLSGVSKACSSQGNQILRILLLRFKSLVLATCSQVSRSGNLHSVDHFYALNSDLSIVLSSWLEERSNLEWFLST